jgi:hypothetical protein
MIHSTSFPATRVLAGVFAPFALSVAASAQLTVVSVEPAMNAGNVLPNADIVVSFDRAIDLSALPPATDDLKVFGKSTGPAAGTWTLDAGGLAARFTPSAPFAAGEIVQLGVSHDLVAADGSPLRSAGFQSEFRIRTRPASLTFTERDTLNVRSPQGGGVRVYGGQASDLNDDGFVDLAIVNQDSSDIRVFLNRADGTPTFEPFLTPPAATGNTPSPNESCDMNGDGLMDIVTGDKFGDTVSVLMGRGDGTFDPSVQYAMGDLPRGLAVFDMDGDGDSDVVSANANSSNLAIRLNNGDGTLGPQTSFNGGGNLEWGLASGDMNNDGIIDLVVGAQGSQRLIVWLGDGDGTFTQGGVLNGAGRVWMVVLGDINGDGYLDASTSNGVDASGTIALGDGNGGLSMQQVQSTGGLVVATDLGDLDGDGDLDWIMSAFSGGSWAMLENDGAGNFSTETVFIASDHPACALLFDFDGDQDLDIALLDEIADEVVLWENTSPETNFCSPAANSTGLPATVSFTGSTAIADNDVTLHVGPMPDGFGFFFYGQSTAPGTSVGNGVLCLGGSLFRSTPAFASGNLLSTPFDLANPPVPAAAILSGSTWNFQLVFRDTEGGGAGFNFSDGLQLTFN